MFRYPKRPRSLPGLVLYLWAVYLRKYPIRTTLITALPIFLSMALLSRCEPKPEPPPPDASELRVGTFNIEHYPRSNAQAANALGLISTLDTPIIALQEITNVDHLLKSAHQHLGPSWHFAYQAYRKPPAPGKKRHHHGVLYDSNRVTLLSTTLHHETRIPNEGGKPTFEARFKDPNGDTLRVLVVHLKSRTEGLPLRLKQHQGLRTIVERVRDQDRALVLMGDFNATAPEDRDALAALARDFDLHWNTEALLCSAYWDRSDGCRSSRLDHILSSEKGQAQAYGACKDVGCEPGATCPIYTREVSDHCPVVLGL